MARGKTRVNVVGSALTTMLVPIAFASCNAVSGVNDLAFSGHGGAGQGGGFTSSSSSSSSRTGDAGTVVIDLSEVEETSQYSISSGMATATESWDSCPEHEALIGFKGQRVVYISTDPTSFVIGRLQAICGTLVVSGSMVTVVPGAQLEVRGAAAGEDWTAQCPTNEVVVGLSARAGAVLDQIVVRCAPIRLVSGMPTTIAAEAMTLDAVGGPGGAAYGPMDCPEGDTATGTHIHSTTWLYELRLVCSSMTATSP